MAPAGGAVKAMMAKNMKFMLRLYKKTSGVIKGQFPAPLRTAQSNPQPVYAHISSRQPLSRAAYLQQVQARALSTHAAQRGAARHFTNSTSPVGRSANLDRAAFPKSRTGDAVRAYTGRAPFASTLRPNLTGGTLGRTAGGYGLGGGRVGGARYFSHTPAAPAQVIHNVNQAIRAFAVGGKKAQFDGVDPRTGEKRYKTVTVLQDKAHKTMSSLPRTSPGSFIDFKVNPTITALTPLGAVSGFSFPSAHAPNLNSDGLLDVLSVDFSRALKDLAIVLKDLQRLSRLGDLVITHRDSTVLRVHFPGCDSATVEKLCHELGVQRGAVGQDEDFDSYAGTEIALLFPFAPSKTVSECSFFQKPIATRQHAQQQIHWQHMLSPSSTASFTSSGYTSPAYSTRSDAGLDFFDELDELDVIAEELDANPWRTSPRLSGYETFHTSEAEEADSPPSYEDSMTGSGGRLQLQQSQHTPLEYQGIEGIYRFIEQCDAAAARR